MSETTPNPPRRSLLRVAVVVGVVAAAAAALVTALLVNIFEKKTEAQNPFFRVVEIGDDVEDPAVWGKDFPLQFDQYKKTVDQVRTRYGGSEAVPHTPTQADPRGVVAQSKLEEDPRLVTLWAGYAFSKDFREDRGHAYMLTDQELTQRQVVVKQPGTCIQCHASVYLPMKRLGNGDLTKGFEALNHMSYAEARKEVSHPVACIDCHDPKTMALRVTRPAFMEGIARVKASAGIQDYDVNRMASRQEMRAYVCGQCHVEYYFKGTEKRLTFPWDKGLQADRILAYYDEIGFKDWVHKETEAPSLKAQHPEFETWSQGVHARSGVSCADCHMPYIRVGAQKISDHHVRSPLLNVANACQTCHRYPESEIRERVDQIQNRHYELRNHAMDALMDLIRDVKDAKEKGLTDEQLKKPRDFHRKASFLLDFAEAENSTGFHAPQEGSRILGLSLDYSRQGQQMLAALWREKAGAGAPSQPARAPAGVDAPRPTPGAVVNPSEAARR
ncbi:MAG TPA: ammonia-forming cytochrome c nitrite reductase subunit c552 [Myxococcales bacterium]